MARAKATTGMSSRGLLSRPLDALVFLLPLILFYEIASFSSPERVIAFDLLQRSFELFGHAGIWGPGLVVVIILLATHVVSGEAWTIHWRRVGWMYVEASALALPLLVLNQSIPPSMPIAGAAPKTIASPVAQPGPRGLKSAAWVAENWDSPGYLSDRRAIMLSSDAPAPTDRLYHRLAIGIGAGIYEELLFRLILISLVVMVGVDLLRWDATGTTVFAVALSAIVFALHHHEPIGQEPFHAVTFAFRSIAGAYLAVVFWYRGYGPAAGCHAAYNVGLAMMEWRTGL